MQSVLVSEIEATQEVNVLNALMWLGLWVHEQNPLHERCMPPGGDFHVKRTGVLVGIFENKPLKVARSCFVGVA